MCQFKEQTDDSGNSKYFDLLPAILEDCRCTLSTPFQTLTLRSTVVKVLYQLVLVCPTTLITTVIPKLIPVLIELIRETRSEEYYCID